MDQSPQERASGRWAFVAGVFFAGLLAGLVLAGLAGEFSASRFLLAFLSIGVALLAGAALFGAGWLMRSGSAPDTIAPANIALDGQDLPSPEKRTTPAPALALGAHLQVLNNEGRWTIRVRDLLGYEWAQLSFGLNRDWFARSESASGNSGQATPRGLDRREMLSRVLFVASLLVYAFTRLYALDRFPINFFADEAIQVLNGIDLVRHGFRDPQGTLFPMYFNIFYFVNPDISVYLHAATATLFGKSIVVARATSSILTLLAAAGIGVVLKSVYNARYWWAVVLLLAITPTWFLHSRTAFDAAAMVSLYALFIVFYLLYRHRSPRYLFGALILAAATFYAYPSGQPTIGLLVLFVIVTDLKYHIQNARLLLWSVPLIVLLAIPFIRFEILHPGEATYHLRAVNSYWTQNIPVIEKIEHSASTYVQLLSPGYWFVPNEQDLIRHRMKDYGLLPFVELPLLLIGIGLCLRRFKEPRYRVGLMALLVSPVGAALADIGILRALAFVVPAALLSALGLEWLLERLKDEKSHLAASAAVFGVLALMSGAMLQDALNNGPRWYSDYTLYGMQWGAKQLFQEAVPQLLADYPNSTIYVTHTWANGSDVFLQFFDVNEERVQIKNVDEWLNQKTPLDPTALFVMTPDEYDKAINSPKFKTVDVYSTIPYPDGRDGFYVTHLEYADNIDKIFAAEREARLKPVTETVTIDGEEVQLAHTKFDIGSAEAMFDGDLYSVARGVEANPLILDMTFSKPRPLHGLDAYLGRADVRVTAHLYAAKEGKPVDYEAEFSYGSTSTELPAGPLAQMIFGNAPPLVSRLRLELAYPHDGETAHVHVFELALR